MVNKLDRKLRKVLFGEKKKEVLKCLVSSWREVL